MWQKMESWGVFVIGVFAFIANVMLCSILLFTNDTNHVLYLPVVAALVVLAQWIEKAIKQTAVERVIRNLADCSFGIYLIHTFGQYFLRTSGLEMILFSTGTLSGIVLYTIILLTGSWLVVTLLRKTKLGRAIT